MATNLGSANGTSFNTANMKPEPNDQVDSLWGQNIADNQAYLRWRKSLAVSMGPTALRLNDDNESGEFRGTCYFIYDSSFGTLAGKLRYSFDGNFSGAEYFRAAFDGTNIEFDTGILSDTDVTFAKSISHFPEGSHGEPIPVTIRMYGTANENNVTFSFEGLTAWLQP